MRNFLFGRVIGPLIRHGATAAGGWLMAEGIADAEAAQQIAGGLIAAGGIALSFGQQFLLSRFGFRL